MSIKLFKEKILPVIFRHIRKDECAVFLFGSLAQNQAVKSSDIDIGIVCAQPLANLTLLKIKQELEKITLRDVDLVDFAAVSDKEFLNLALRRIKVCHQTRKSKAYLANLRRRARG